MTASSVTRHEDGIQHGSTKLMVCLLDFRIFELFVRLPLSRHHVSYGPDRHDQTHT